VAVEWESYTIEVLLMQSQYCLRLRLLLVLLQKSHHPFIHGPLHCIDNKGPHAADAQPSPEDTGPFCPIGLSGDLEGI